jgi:hypothetical protein
MLCLLLQIAGQAVWPSLNVVTSWQKLNVAIDVFPADIFVAGNLLAANS